jgi:hypothetical protein
MPNRQVPLKLLRPDPAERKAVAKQHIGAHDEREHERDPRGGAADEIDEAIDRVGQPFG